MFLRAEVKQLLSGDHSHVRAWLWHVPAVSVVLLWVLGICRIPFSDYLLFFVYPGLMLTALRSFAEHQAAGEPEQRSVIVEAGPVLRLLYLGNNLHALHHREPALPWYRLLACWRERRSELLRTNGHYYYRGYYEVLARHLLWPKEWPFMSEDNRRLVANPGVNQVQETAYR
jgi:fatty acid desaturase